MAATLASGSSRPLVSLDDLVCRQTGLSIPEIFFRQGEAAFRRLELSALSGCVADGPLLMDTGGGVVETPAAVALLQQRGVVIWLDAAWGVIRERLEKSTPDSRPLVAKLGWDGLEKLHGRRSRLYAQAADFRLSADRGSVRLARTVMLRSLAWQRQRERVFR